jgi:hypothetical protein
MKHADPHDEIAALLRTRQPDPQPSPSLEARILRELDRRQHRKPARLWPWFALPPAFAALVLAVISYKPADKQQVMDTKPVPTAPAPKNEAADALIGEGNPLKEETVALGRDARRAGRFLIDCLPFAKE